MIKSFGYIIGEVAPSYIWDEVMIRSQVISLEGCAIVAVA